MISVLGETVQRIRRLSLRVLVLARSIISRPQYQFSSPRATSSRADNGQGLILSAITKTLLYNLFITYSILSVLTYKTK